MQNISCVLDGAHEWKKEILIKGRIKTGKKIRLAEKEKQRKSWRKKTWENRGKGKQNYVVSSMAPVTKLKTIKYGHLNISVMRILELDEFINEVGQCGLYQLRTQILFAIFMIPLSTQIFMTYFVMHDPPWRCVRNSTICKYRDVIVPQDHVRFTTRCNMPRAEWEFVMPKRYSLVTEVSVFVCSWITSWMPLGIYENNKLDVLGHGQLKIR